MALDITALHNVSSEVIKEADEQLSVRRRGRGGQVDARGDRECP